MTGLVLAVAHDPPDLGGFLALTSLLADGPPCAGSGLAGLSLWVRWDETPLTLAPRGDPGAVLAGHGAETAVPGGRGVDVGIRAAAAGADAKAGGVVFDELVAQG